MGEPKVGVSRLRLIRSSPEGVGFGSCTGCERDGQIFRVDTNWGLVTLCWDCYSIAGANARRFREERAKQKIGKRRRNKKRSIFAVSGGGFETKRSRH